MPGATPNGSRAYNAHEQRHGEADEHGGGERAGERDAGAGDDRIAGFTTTM